METAWIAAELALLKSENARIEPRDRHLAAIPVKGPSILVPDSVGFGSGEWRNDYDDKGQADRPE